MSLSAGGVCLGTGGKEFVVDSDLLKLDTALARRGEKPPRRRDRSDEPSAEAIKFALHCQRGQLEQERIKSRVSEAEFRKIFGEDALLFAKEQGFISGDVLPDYDYTNATLFLLKGIAAVCPHGGIMALVKESLKKEIQE